MAIQTATSCTSSEHHGSTSSTILKGANSDNSTVGPLIANGKGGAQLWGENCVRCHNAPPPTAYGDDQWTVIGQHMRVRANITRDETEKIIEFMKNAN